MKETKLLDILPPIDLDDFGFGKFVEDPRLSSADLTLLRLESVENVEERQSSRSVMNCYDMGGHMQYYCAQKIFKNNSSIYLLTFERLDFYEKILFISRNYLQKDL